MSRQNHTEIWTGCKDFQLKEGRFRLDVRKTFFYNEGGETLQQVAQRGGRCSILGNIQSQVGCNSGQSDLFEDVPAHGRGVGTR